MYAYLNDLSMSFPNKNKGQNAWTLLKEVILISSVFNEQYSIEQLKVPTNFISIKIGDLDSIQDLISDEHFELENKQFIYDFLANRTFSTIDEIDDEILEQIGSKDIEWIRLEYKEENSQLLLGSFLLNKPTVSFRTDQQFDVDTLVCDFFTEYSDRTHKKKVEISNFYLSSKISVPDSSAFLIGIKNEILFGRGEWDPTSHPIWNKKTPDLIEAMDFPQSIKGKKTKMAELQEVGKKIAELNSWIFDLKTTKLNKNKGQYRVIFTSVSEKKKSYLSIDMKNAFGRFELHNDKGNHLGEIKFIDGNYVPRGSSKTGKDDNGHHDIVVKK